MRRVERYRANCLWVAYREKDRAFVRVLLVEGLIDADVFASRIELMPIEEGRKASLKRWIEMTAAEL